MVEAPAFSDLVEGTRAEVEFSISRADMRVFAELSGDFNPLHQDAAFAQKKAFQSEVVYGALIIAKVSQLIGMRLPGRDSVWSSIALQFRQPLYVDQIAKVEGVIINRSESTKMLDIKLTVRANGKLLASGKAEVLFVEA
jgi:acyl dehydratase